MRSFLTVSIPATLCADMVQIRLGKHTPAFAIMPYVSIVFLAACICLVMLQPDRYLRHLAVIVWTFLSSLLHLLFLVGNTYACRRFSYERQVMPKDQKKKRKRPVVSGPPSASGATISSPTAPQVGTSPSAALTATVWHGMASFGCECEP